MAEKKIGNRVYKFHRLNAIDSARLLARLLKVGGPAAGLLRALSIDVPHDDKKPEELTDEQRAERAPKEAERDEAFIKAAEDFVTKIDDDAVVQLLDEVTRMATVDGAEALPTMMDLQEMTQVVWFVLETEYSSFLSDSGARSFLSPSRRRRAA